MRCRDFEDHVMSWIDGAGLPFDGARMSTHADECAECGRLHAALLADSSDLERAPDLTSRVLALTSGRACDRARDLLCAEQAVTPADASLMRAHFATCVECGAAARVVALLPELLPQLSWREPDGDFLHDVLAATSGYDPEVEGRASESLWQRLLRRPRLALEGAYVGTLAMMLVVGLPGASLAEIPNRVFDELRQERVRVEQVVSVPLAGLAAAGREVWSRAEALSFSEVAEQARSTSWYDRAVALGASVRGQWQTVVEFMGQQTARFVEWMVSAWQQYAAGIDETNQERNDE